jgi:ABC-type uncharacterized transport system ATPase subunit
MIGRDLRPLASSEAPETPTAPTAATQPALQVEHLTWRDAARATRLDVTFSVARGEIVGVAGVEGNGQSELGALLAGMLTASSGRILLAGMDITSKSPRELTRLGVGCVPEDRHAVGCHLNLDVAENLFLGQLTRYTRFGWLRRAAMYVDAAPLLAAFDVRGSATSRMGGLSGGNQQKVVLARELSLEPLLFLLAAQPTRGLDAGAVEAVYTDIRRARDRGVGVLLVSSELEELLAVADRVLVIYRGRIVGDVAKGPDQNEIVGRLMSGQAAREVA